MNTILHLGLGSFHRAHQAVYVHQLRQQGDTRWSITGGNLRPDMLDTIAALQAQNGRYTLETVTPQGQRSYTVIESIQRVIPYQDDLAPLIAAGADPATRIISFTVTEAGYYLDAKNQLDWATFPDLRADLAAVKAGQAGHTIYGGLVSILRARMQASAGPSP
jgi:D-arabinitol 4-dehydrogenase